MELRRSSRLKTHVAEHEEVGKSTDEAGKSSDEALIGTQMRKRRRPGVGVSGVVKAGEAGSPGRAKCTQQLRRPLYVEGTWDDGSILAVETASQIDLTIVDACRGKLREMTNSDNATSDSILRSIVSQVEGLVTSLKNVESEDKYDHADLLEQVKREVQSPSMSEADFALAQTLGDAKISDEAIMKFVARLHGIDMQDVVDITVPREKHTDRPSGKRNDFQLINNRINRMLARERDMSLHWPDKRKKAFKKSKPEESSPICSDRTDEFDDVALFS